MDRPGTGAQEDRTPSGLTEPEARHRLTATARVRRGEATGEVTATGPRMPPATCRRRSSASSVSWWRSMAC